MAGAEKWAASMPVPAYAIDGETAIKVTGGTVELVSEGAGSCSLPDIDGVAKIGHPPLAARASLRSGEHQYAIGRQCAVQVSAGGSCRAAVSPDVDQLITSFEVNARAG
jgi:hypothetical protein